MAPPCSPLCFPYILPHPCGSPWWEQQADKQPLSHRALRPPHPAPRPPSTPSPRDAPAASALPEASEKLRLSHTSSLPRQLHGGQGSPDPAPAGPPSWATQAGPIERGVETLAPGHPATLTPLNCRAWGLRSTPTSTHRRTMNPRSPPLALWSRPQPTAAPPSAPRLACLGVSEPGRGSTRWPCRRGACTPGPARPRFLVGSQPSSEHRSPYVLFCPRVA